MTKVLRNLREKLAEEERQHRETIRTAREWRLKAEEAQEQSELNAAECGRLRKERDEWKTERDDIYSRLMEERHATGREIDRLTKERVEALAETTKWRRIRTPTHGPCCTCQACGLDYDSCRCDLDDLADDLVAARDEIARLKSERERLRGALETYRDIEDWPQTEEECGGDFWLTVAVTRLQAQAARAALTPPENDDA